MRTLALLENGQVIRMDGDTITCTDVRAADRLAASVEPVLETYRLAALALSEVRWRDTLPEWEIVIRTFAVHDRLYLEGRALYPESRNRSAVKLALRSFADLGALRTPRPKYYELAGGDDGPEGFAQLARRIEGEQQES
jgi:hypothetical protein